MSAKKYDRSHSNDIRLNFFRFKLKKKEKKKEAKREVNTLCKQDKVEDCIAVIIIIRS